MHKIVKMHIAITYQNPSFKTSHVLPRPANNNYNIVIQTLSFFSNINCSHIWLADFMWQDFMIVSANLLFLLIFIIE